MKTPIPWSRAVLAIAAVFTLAGGAHAASEKIGTVDTAFQWIGRDHDILVEAYDDPGVPGVTCYVSRARCTMERPSPVPGCVSSESRSNSLKMRS